MPPPRFDADAEVWVGICPWCGHEETHQVGTETRHRAILWCRTCSGSSFLVRGEADLTPRTPPKVLHDKRRKDGQRLPKQKTPVIGGSVPSEYRSPRW